MEAFVGYCVGVLGVASLLFAVFSDGQGEAALSPAGFKLASLAQGVVQVAAAAVILG